MLLLPLPLDPLPTSELTFSILKIYLLQVDSPSVVVTVGVGATGGLVGADGAVSEPVEVGAVVEHPRSSSSRIVTPACLSPRSVPSPHSPRRPSAEQQKQQHNST